MEQTTSDFFKELAACCRFKWRGMNPDYKLFWKTLGVCLVVLVGAVVISGLALLVGPR